MVLVVLLWAQTGSFSEPIAEYRLGADGWPKVVQLGLAFGATAQFLLQFFRHWRNPASPTSAASGSASPATSQRSISRVQQISIFVAPFCYLFLMQRMGFLLTTPIFIAAYLWILEVRDWRYLLAVSLGVYFLVTFIFIRMFYVALPIGSWAMFYEINNVLIALIRIGV